MTPDDYRQRRPATPDDEAPPAPIGWNPDGTHTGNPGRPGAGVDPFDSRPSRNPYPGPVPNLAADIRPDHHMRLLHHYSKRAFDERILLEGGEDALPAPLRRGTAHRRAELRQVLLRRKAILEELTQGVVVLSDDDQRLIDLGGDEPDTAAA